MTKFPIPIYLNQKYVFDILAMLEDGFSHFQTLKTVSSTSIETALKSQGEVGLNNVFAFLGIKMSGEAGKNNKDGNEVASETKKIHTPNSLFGKLISLLEEKNLCKKENILQSNTGDFILFKATLRKNPAIDALESHLALFKLIQEFQENNHSNKTNKSKEQSDSKLINQFEILVKQLKLEGSLDLVGDNKGKEEFKVVLTIDRDYLNDPSLSDIVDGDFYVLGKTIRVITSADEEINLLRKTSLGNFSPPMLEKFFSGFRNLAQHGLKDVEINTTIAGPVLQVIPISIYA
ncbi:DUF6414 family protein [Hymenobacter properus]|uniref:Uncharacterized protein n=1 Tax=Hymenobacter properus TaxID=2791026 RepID=A0A931BDI9_9BACT|nr:hypothetical protein [Hymenobacter properus]MBF9140543.1 hypothetical protein [Hymenobacter properus]MBR7719350.1 hypothetical protein [Microvirga sp. SRT04]